jgi:hypothetical protein
MSIKGTDDVSSYACGSKRSAHTVTVVGLYDGLYGDHEDYQTS